VRSALVNSLNATTAEECARLLRGVASQFEGFQGAMPRALRGEWPSIVFVVNRWLGLLDAVLESASALDPKSVRKTDDHFVMLTASGAESDEPVHFLEHDIADVPFSPVVTRFGLGVGIGIGAIEAVRSLLPGWPVLRLDDSAGWPNLPEGSDPVRYRRLVDIALRSMQPPLVRMRELLGLSTTEIAELFNVTRQAVEQWEKNGHVPAARSEKLANVLTVGELLERKLKPGRLPLVARRRAPDYGGLTMLEMIEGGRDKELRELTERSFDWSTTA
jgi:transcriptional regulator with XRE-family HTH domain